MIVQASFVVDAFPFFKRVMIPVLIYDLIGQVEMLKDSVPCIEELHLIGNNIKEITGCFFPLPCYFAFDLSLKVPENLV